MYLQKTSQGTLQCINTGMLHLFSAFLLKHEVCSFLQILNTKNISCFLASNSTTLVYFQFLFFYFQINSSQLKLHSIRQASLLHTEVFIDLVLSTAIQNMDFLHVPNNACYVHTTPCMFSLLRELNFNETFSQNFKPRNK